MAFRAVIASTIAWISLSASRRESKILMYALKTPQKFGPARELWLQIHLQSATQFLYGGVLSGQMGLDLLGLIQYRLRIGVGLQCPFI